MATTIPHAALLPSSTFINIEDFDSRHPEPQITQLDAQNALTFNSINSNVAGINVAGSEAGGLTMPFPPDLGGRNWIGKLLEYHQAHPSTEPPAFKEITVTSFVPRFACTVMLSEHTETFGSMTQHFARKKDAKQYACKLAIEWLVENGHMPSVDSVAVPKTNRRLPSQLVPSGSAAGAIPATELFTEITPAAKVVQMCTELHMNPPTYVMNSEPATPMFWSGHAYFPLEPRVDGPVGKFTNIFGKKNAKEKCVMDVLDFLEGIKRQMVNTTNEV